MKNEWYPPNDLFASFLYFTPHPRNAAWSGLRIGLPFFDSPDAPMISNSKYIVVASPEDLYDAGFKIRRNAMRDGMWLVAPHGYIVDEVYYTTEQVMQEWASHYEEESNPAFPKHFLSIALRSACRPLK